MPLGRAGGEIVSHARSNGTLLQAVNVSLQPEEFAVMYW